MADLRELASTGFPSARTVLGSFQPHVRETAMCNVIKCGALQVGPSPIDAVYEVSLVGQAIAVLTRGAWAPSGNRRPNRNIAFVIEGQ